MKSIFLSILFVCCFLFVEAQTGIRIGSFYPSPLLPADAVSLNPNSQYPLGGCSYASSEEIRICRCHVTLDGKIKIGSLTDDMPKMTGYKQIRWKTQKNKIIIIFQNGKSQVKKTWAWDGQKFNLL